MNSDDKRLSQSVYRHRKHKRLTFISWKLMIFLIFLALIGIVCAIYFTLPKQSENVSLYKAICDTHGSDNPDDWTCEEENGEVVSIDEAVAQIDRISKQVNHEIENKQSNSIIHVGGIVK